MHMAVIIQPGPEVIKLFSCSTQLRMKIFLLINVKMPTIGGILTFMSGKNGSLGLSELNISQISWHFCTYEHLKFYAQLSWEWKKFYNLQLRALDKRGCLMIIEEYFFLILISHWNHVLCPLIWTILMKPCVVSPHLNHLNETMYCVPSSEPPDWDSSDEGSQNMFYAPPPPPPPPTKMPELLLLENAHLHTFILSMVKKIT